ncbi:hypothetical protein J2X20_005500 [Pelomonas saccharophila]|uniref:Uncharacterized protein n=1 Tax=Roseateles saccharophilus TaxID=304 RepID=A0ABU1YVC3_ROSSA|nr:hypothetical protein [Roseateles saccharophilus]MDR7272817.1 hypothetical protein [Roseateles saccharophilus]
MKRMLTAALAAWAGWAAEANPADLILRDATVVDMAAGRLLDRLRLDAMLKGVGDWVAQQ